jgi:dihydrofolate reductase
MRKVALDLAVSLDGFIEGPNGEYDWCMMDEEFDFNSFLNTIDSILFGRKSYQLWGNYIPEDNVPDDEKRIWAETHKKKKYVFSRTLESVESPTTLISGNIPEEISRIKAQPGKDIWLFGGAGLVTTFINLKLIDILRLAVHPIILGSGKPLFIGISGRVILKKPQARIFSSGVVLLTYQLNK